MSMAVDIIKCDKCGGVMDTFEDFSLYSYYEFCNSCGKGNFNGMKFDDEGHPCLDEEGEPIWESNSYEGLGVSRIYRGNLNHTNTHLVELNQCMIDEFLEEIEAEGVCKEKCYLTKWDDEKQEVIAVYGKLPKSFDEEFEDSEFLGIGFIEDEDEDIIPF